MFSDKALKRVMENTGLPRPFETETPFYVLLEGWVADGNLHINILRPEGMTKDDFVKECRKVDVLVFEAIMKHKIMNPGKVIDL